MKKLFAVLGALLLFVQIFCCACGYTNTEDKLLRVHVRADSDSVAAQSVKREIAEAIDCYLTGELEGVEKYDDLLDAVRTRLGAVEAIASAMLRRKGFGYGAKATLTREKFDERRIGDTLIPAGEYDSLCVVLGSGGGDNWWTVIYPDSPNASGVKYKSVIAEILGKS